MRISDWSSDVCSSDLKSQRHLQARPQGRWIVVQCESHVVQLGHGGDEAEAEAAARGAAAGIEPHEALQHALTVFGRNAGAAVGDGQPGSLPGGDEAEADARSEEHTSELQSLMRISYAVFCLKKK